MGDITKEIFSKLFHIFRATLTPKASASSLHIRNGVSSAGLGANLPGAEEGKLALLGKKFRTLTEFRQKRVKVWREISM